MRFAVVGHPVSHSKSPMIHREFGQQFGLEIQYGLIDAREEEFSNLVTQFFQQGGEGLNVTMPHKARAAQVADSCSEVVKQTGVANTLGVDDSGVIWCDNTDGVGLITDLQKNHGVSLAEKKILLLGAGGAAQGIFPNLLKENPVLLGVYNRTQQRAHTLLSKFDHPQHAQVLGQDEIIATEWDLIINCTSAGLSTEDPLLPDTAISSHTVTYDLQYGDAAKPFCRWASGLGAAQVLNGWGMLVEQAARSFELWHGLKPDTSAMQSGHEALGFRF